MTTMLDFRGRAQSTYEILRALLPDGHAVRHEYVLPSREHVLPRTLSVGPERVGDEEPRPDDFTITFHPDGDLEFSGTRVLRTGHYDVLQVLAIITRYYAAQELPTPADACQQADALLGQAHHLVGSETAGPATAEQETAMAEAWKLVGRARAQLRAATKNP